MTSLTAPLALWYEHRVRAISCFRILSTVCHLVPDIIVADLGVGIDAFGFDV